MKWVGFTQAQAIGQGIGQSGSLPTRQASGCRRNRAPPSEQGKPEGASSQGCMHCQVADLIALHRAARTWLSMNSPTSLSSRRAVVCGGLQSTLCFLHCKARGEGCGRGR